MRNHIIVVDICSPELAAKMGTQVWTAPWSAHFTPNSCQLRHLISPMRISTYGLCDVGIRCISTRFPGQSSVLPTLHEWIFWLSSHQPKPYKGGGYLDKHHIPFFFFAHFLPPQEKRGFARRRGPG
jgi:hypothetical protein